MSAARPWSAWVLAWLGAFFGFVVVAHGNLESSDSGLTMHAARVLWQRGDSGLLRADQGGELLGEQKAAEYIAYQQSIAAPSMGKVGAGGRAYVWFPVGHVWLLAPFAALGDVLEVAFPAVEQRWREVAAPGANPSQLVHSVTYVYGHPLLTQGLIAVLVPPMFAATSALLLFLLARTLGAGGRDALLGTLAIVLATQLFALGSSTLSDGPGLCLLLAALLVTVRAHLGRASTGELLAGGALAGASVLLRYQNALAIAVCAGVVALACRRQRRWSPLLWFVVGGLPFAALSMAVNHARFGNPFDTGYPEYESWFTEPLWLGLAKLLFAAGRGVMWFSPVLWLALPLAMRRPHVPVLRWFAWVLFALPFLMFGTARGWQGGECWGARYVTPGVVVLLALVLPQARPWHTWPRLWTGLLVCGLFVNLTGVVAPVRGQIQLATQAAQAEAQRVQRPLDDPADPVSWRPRFSPLHSNWSYVVHSRVGGFEDEQGGPRHGSDHTIEPLFGIAAVEPAQGRAPLHWEDRCGRHLWWRMWADLLGVPGWILLGPVLLLALGCGASGWRRLAVA